MEIEEAFIFDETLAWTNSTPQRLGALLLVTGKPKEAEEVYLRDLKRFEENGWSLMGLALSLEAQGRHREHKPDLREHGKMRLFRSVHHD